jgi:hypothetical protein
MNDNEQWWTSRTGRENHERYSKLQKRGYLLELWKKNQESQKALSYYSINILQGVIENERRFQDAPVANREAHFEDE